MYNIIMHSGKISLMHPNEYYNYVIFASIIKETHRRLIITFNFVLTPITAKFPKSIELLVCVYPQLECYSLASKEH